MNARSIEYDCPLIPFQLVISLDPIFRSLVGLVCRMIFGKAKAPVTFKATGAHSPAPNIGESRRQWNAGLQIYCKDAYISTVVDRMPEKGLEPPRGVNPGRF